MNDKLTDPPKDALDTQEIAPDPQDENPILKKETKIKDGDNDLPTVSDWDPALNMCTSTDVGTGVAISNNSPFTTDDTTTEERLETASVSNVDDVIYPHINDGDESTIPNEGTDNEHHPCRWYPNHRYLNNRNVSFYLCFMFISFHSNRRPTDD
jgi:hypothetical protein